MPFVNTLLEEEKPAFRNTLSEPQKPFVNTLIEESVSDNPFNLKGVAELTNFTHPFIRTGEILQEEVTQGAKEIGEAFTGAPPTTAIGTVLNIAAPTLRKTGKAVLGASQIAFSPLTAPIRAFVGEPAKELAEQAGASPETAGLIQTGTEMILFLLAPLGFPKAVNAVLAGKDPFLLAKLNAPRSVIPTGISALKKETEEISPLLSNEIKPTSISSKTVTEGTPLSFGKIESGGSGVSLTSNTIPNEGPYRITEWLDGKPIKHVAFDTYSEALKDFKTFATQPDANGIVADTVRVGTNIAREGKKESLKEAGEELAKRIIQPELPTAEKARQFLETDLSKIEVPLPGVDRQVNYANYLITTEDAKKAIVASEKLRGSTKITIPFSQTEKEAAQSGLGIKDLLNRGVRQGHNAVQMEAFKGIINAASRNTFALRDKINAGTASEVERALFMVQFDELMNIQRQFQGAKGEVARSLNILRKPTENAPQLKALKDLADGKLTLLNGKKVEDLGANELADLLKGLDNNELSEFVKQASKATKMQKFVEAYKAGLLTGLRTNEANLVTNLAIDPLMVVERTVSATLGKILPRGTDQDKVFFREIPAMISGMINGAREGARIAGRTLLKGPSAESAEKAIDASRVAAIGGTTGQVVRAPFRILAAADDFFKEVARRAELNALATRQAIKDGKTTEEIKSIYTKLTSDPPEAMSEAATQFGKYSTFNKELGAPGKAFMSFVRTHPALQIMFPFIRTVTNIFKFAGERTPLAVFSPAVRAEFKAGGGQRDMAIAKIMTGTSISTWAAWMAADGRITGRGPNDPGERRAWLASGKKPYSYKIETDQGVEWLPLNRFEPFSTLLGPAADAIEIMKRSEEDEKTNASVLIIKSFTANVTNKTFVSSAVRAINALTDPERFGESFTEGLAGSLIPTLSSEIAQSGDPILREPQNPLEAMQARIPGLSKELKPRRDIFGMPIERHKGGTDAFNIFALSKETDDKSYTELERLKLKIQPPERKIGGKETPIDLYDRYEEDSGRLAKSFVDKLVNNPRYDDLPRLDKETLIKSFFTESRKITRLKLGLETEKQIKRIEKTRQGLIER